MFYSIKGFKYGAKMYNILKKELINDEEILWSGQGDSKKLFTTGDAFMIPFSLMWGGFAFFWETSVLMMDAPLLFKIWGIPFVLIGLYMIFGRFFYKKLKKEKTLYAITNKRIFIIETLIKLNITSEFIKNLPAINKSVNKKGIGNIIFGTGSFGVGMYANSGLDVFGNIRNGIPIGFYDIPNVESVYKKIIELKNNEEK